MKKGLKVFITIFCVLLLIAVVIISIKLYLNNLEKNRKYSNENSDVPKSTAIIAEKRAIDYIKNKYGFSPEITGFIRQTDPPIGLITLFAGGTPSSYVYVKAEYNGRQFMVHVDTKENSSDCSDNYQEKEIQKALKDYYSNLSPIEPDDMSVDYYYIEHEYNPSINGNFTSDYFEEDKIEDFIKNKMLSIRFYFVELENFEDTFDIKDLAFGYTKGIYFFNCRSKSACRDLKDVLSNDAYIHDNSTSEDYAIYFSEFYSYEKSSSEYKSCDLLSSGNLLVHKYDSTDSIVIQDLGYSNEYEDGSLNYKPISNTYKISSYTKKRTILYIPKSILTKDSTNIGIGILRDGKSFCHKLGNVSGDYLLFTFPSSYYNGSTFELTVYDMPNE